MIIGKGAAGRKSVGDMRRKCDINPIGENRRKADLRGVCDQIDIQIQRARVSATVGVPTHGVPLTKVEGIRQHVTSIGHLSVPERSIGSRSSSRVIFIG